MIHHQFSDFDYDHKDDTLSNILEEGVTCALRMRFECTVWKAINTKDKTATSLQEEIALGDSDATFSASHDRGPTFCILNDVVVVSILYLLLFRSLLISFLPKLKSNQIMLF